VPIVKPTTDVGAERLAWILMVCALVVSQLIIDKQQLSMRQSTTQAHGFPESPSKPW